MAKVPGKKTESVRLRLRISKEVAKDALEEAVRESEEEADDDSDCSSKKMKEEDDSRVLRKVSDMVYILNDSEEVFDEFAGQTQGLLSKKMLERSPKVAKMYLNYQTLFFRFVKKYKVEDVQDEKMLIEFFEVMGDKYSPSTLWVIYSCVNSWMIENGHPDLKYKPLLRKVLKFKTDRWVAKKANVFSPEDVHNCVMHFSKDTNPKTGPKNFQRAITILLLYYGLLRVDDVLKIQVKDVKLNKEGKFEISFFYQRKRFNNGFTYTIPAIYTHLITRYIKELKPQVPNQKKNLRFLKNWNVRGKTRIQNAGRNFVDRVAKDAAEYLGYDPSTYSGHSWRRSAATNLADAGVTLTNLKRHGQWKSDTVCEGYMANSKPLRDERETLLLPKAHQAPTEKSKEVKAIEAMGKALLAVFAKHLSHLSPHDDTKMDLPEKGEKEEETGDEIEYEDIQATNKTHLPEAPISQLGFTQMELAENEESEIAGELEGVPILLKKKKQIVTPSPVAKQRKVPTLRTHMPAVYHNCTFVFKCDSDMKPPAF